MVKSKQSCQCDVRNSKICGWIHPVQHFLALKIFKEIISYDEKTCSVNFIVCLISCEFYYLIQVNAVFI